MIRDSELYEAIGHRIFERRRQMGLTQEQLADAMDVTPQMISSAELGKKAMRPENVIKMATALDVSCDFLLTGHTSSNDLDLILDKARTLDANELQKITGILDLLGNITKE